MTFRRFLISSLLPRNKQPPHHLILGIEHIGSELNALHEAPHAHKGPLAQDGGAHPQAFLDLVLHLGIDRHIGDGQIHEAAVRFTLHTFV
jgi:hypothetical protein